MSGSNWWILHPPPRLGGIRGLRLDYLDLIPYTWLTKLWGCANIAPPRKPHENLSKINPGAPESGFGSQNASWGPSGSQFLPPRFFENSGVSPRVPWPLYFQSPAELEPGGFKTSVATQTRVWRLQLEPGSRDSSLETASRGRKPQLETGGCKSKPQVETASQDRKSRPKAATRDFRQYFRDRLFAPMSKELHVEFLLREGGWEI